MDIKSIPLTATVEQTKEIINEKQNQLQLNDYYRKSKLPLSYLEDIQSMNVPNFVKKFLLTVGNDNDIGFLLDIDLENYSLDQIKYLYSVYSTGMDIDIILNPNLSVEQMKQVIINSSKSIDFLNSVRETHDDRKK